MPFRRSVREGYLGFRSSVDEVEAGQQQEEDKEGYSAEDHPLEFPCSYIFLVIQKTAPGSNTGEIRKASRTVRIQTLFLIPYIASKGNVGRGCMSCMCMHLRVHIRMTCM